MHYLPDISVPDISYPKKKMDAHTCQFFLGLLSLALPLVFSSSHLRPAYLAQVHLDHRSRSALITIVAVVVALRWPLLPLPAAAAAPPPLPPCILTILALLFVVVFVIFLVTVAPTPSSVIPTTAIAAGAAAVFPYTFSLISSYDAYHVPQDEARAEVDPAGGNGGHDNFSPEFGRAVEDLFFLGGGSAVRRRRDRSIG